MGVRSKSHRKPHFIAISGIIARYHCSPEYYVHGQDIFKTLFQSPNHELHLNAISGNWRALPGWLMYRIRELPALLRDAERRIVYTTEISTPPQHTDFFKERQYQYARLGIKALILSIRLRRLVGLPPTRQNATKWSAQTVFWTAWRNERKRRVKDTRWYRELDQDDS